MRNALLLFAACACGAHAADLATDPQRLIQQRDQNALELRLRMQQQQYRALNPPQTPSSDFQLRQVERDQQQRQREQIEQEARERDARDLAPTDATRALRATDELRR